MITLDQTGALLRKSDFFCAASDATVMDLSRRTELIHLSAGEILFEKGDQGTAMYVVIDGRVKVHDGDVVITTREKDHAFGEVAALSGELRTASVSAETDCVLLSIGHEAIYEVIASQADAARTVIAALCRRESEIIGEKMERLLRTRILEREMDIGQRIQRSFLPNRIPELRGWRIEGMLEPARKVAGDFYDYFSIPRLQRIGIVIGDVCDKGVGAALFMTLFRSLIRSGALYGHVSESSSGDDAATNTLRHVIRATNEYIASTHADSSMFASVFFGLLDPQDGRIDYINAGHEPLLIIGDTGIREELSPTGPVIGLFENIAHAVGTAELRPGELLFGYTDGITDAQNASGEAFSEVRLLETLRSLRETRPVELGAVFAAVQAFVMNADRYDDLTMIGVQRELG